MTTARQPVAALLRYTMPRLMLMIAVVLAGQVLSGCASPWSAGRPALALPGTPAPARATTNAASSTASSQTDPQKMQEVMAELQQLGTLDPIAQDQLLEDLRESDPALWPLVMQQFRATAAYRQRAAERGAATKQTGEKGTGPICRNGPEGAAHKLDLSPFPPGAMEQRVERLPTANNVAIAPAEAAQEKNPNPVVPVSYVAPIAEKEAGPIFRNGPEGAAHQGDLSPSGDWRQQLAGAIEVLESEVPENPTTPAEMAQHARLRMLYAAAGRREDAMRPIPAAPPATQQFLSKELDGLTTWLNVDKTPDAARRAAETKLVMVEAVGKLAESAPLTIRNMAFCTEVQSYGCAKRFEKYEFQPNQEVLLYAEMENFASEPTSKGYHTSLRSNYHILDARGQRVAEHAFAATEEYCQNLRRDFFIGYRLRLPKRIDPGKYALQLSVEDLMCRKFGQASIEFEIKQEKEGVAAMTGATAVTEKKKKN